MALTKTLLPVNAPTHALPFDVAGSFGLAVTQTASGFVLAPPLNVSYGPGRMEGYWNIDVSNAKVSAGNETYQFFLLGSNDINFGNGNCENLGVYDIAATSALRDLPTILAASPAIPDTGLSASRFTRAFSNQSDQFVFQFINLYCLIAGTAPTITFSSWLIPWTGQDM